MFNWDIREVEVLFEPDYVREGLCLLIFSGAMQADLEKHLGVERLSVDVVTCLSHLQVDPLPKVILLEV